MKSLNLLKKLGTTGAGSLDEKVANGIVRTVLATKENKGALASIAKSAVVAGVATLADSQFDCTATKVAKNVCVGIAAVKAAMTANKIWNSATEISEEKLSSYYDELGL